MGFDNVDGTQSDCDICITFDAWVVAHYGTYYHAADLSWTYDSEKWVGGGGYTPDDAAGIYFEDDMWAFSSNKISETTNTSDHVEVDDGDITDGLGVVVDDSSAGDGVEKYFTLRLDPVGDYEESSRWLKAEYVHTWNETDVDISTVITTGGVGVSINPEKETELQDTTTEGDGNTFMEIRQDEMETNP